MSNPKDFHVNLFRPRTPHGKSNTKMILTMIGLWFVSIFGFQALLIVLNKPTPEKNYLLFQEIWPKMNTMHSLNEIAYKCKFFNFFFAISGSGSHPKIQSFFLKM